MWTGDLFRRCSFLTGSPVRQDEHFGKEREDSMEKRKIVFHLNCLEHGGAERVVSNLANQFGKEGYEVIVATEWKGEDEFPLIPQVRREIVGLKAGDEKKSRVVQFLLRIKYLRAFLKKEKPDIVIAFAHRAIYRALTAAWGTKLPVIVCCRTDPVGHYDSWSDKLQIRLLFPHAAGAVFQTYGQREFFKPYLQDNSCIILNAVNQKYIDAEYPAVRRKAVVQSGRLVGFKNQAMLIDAFVKVHEKHPDHILQFYGGDSGDGTKAKLEEKIAAYGAGEYIYLMGDSDRLEKELADAAVYAFSSDWEGLPNALVEAMALGLPIVATDCPCGGPATIMTNEVDGLLIPVKDAGAMEEGINRLIEDRELAERLGHEARRIADRVNVASIFEQWRDFIEDRIRTWEGR